MAIVQTPTMQVPTARRPSWRGILAGLLMGLIVVMAMMALALVLGSLIPSISLQGASITAGIYAAITALVSAYVAGFFAVKASAPEVLFGDGTDIDPKDATLTGILTAAAIVVVTTYLTMTGATSLVRGASNVAGTAIAGTAGAVGGGVSAIAGTAGTAATTGASLMGIAGQTELMDEARRAYQQVTGDISRSDIEAMLDKNLDGLDQAQIHATANVVQNMLQETRQDLQNLDFTSLNTWQNLDSYAKERMVHIERVLTGPEFIARLQNQGLTEEQALQVRNEVEVTYSDYKTQTEAKIAETRLRIEQGLQQAEETARKAALYTGLFWLISSGLTFLMSVLGARNAAANYRVVRTLR